MLVPQTDPELDAPGPSDLLKVGVVGEVMQIARHSPNRYTIIVRSGPRVILEKIDKAADGAHMVGAATPLVTIEPPDDETTAALVERARTCLTAILAEQADTSADKVREGLDEVEDPDDLVDMAAAHLDLERDELIALLQERDVGERLRSVLPPLERLSEVVKVKGDIRGELLTEMSKEQREVVLRQRMKSIASELGEQDDEGELETYRERVRNSKMPDEARAAALKQVRKMHAVGAASPEHTIARTYLEWLSTCRVQHDPDAIELPAARSSSSGPRRPGQGQEAHPGQCRAQAAPYHHGPSVHVLTSRSADLLGRSSPRRVGKYGASRSSSFSTSRLPGHRRRTSPLPAASSSG